MVNQMNNDLLFMSIIALVVPLAVAMLLAIAARTGFVWAKVNQPTIAALVGGLIGALYHYEPLYVALYGNPPGANLAAFILAGITAGLAGSGVRSLAKDVSSGAITATSAQDIRNMRKPGPPEIGS